MSISALLRGVETILRGEDVLDDPGFPAVGKLCGVQPLGKPPASMGQLYVAIHWAGATGDDMNPQSSDQLHAVHLTLTARLGFTPRDRRGKVITDALGLYALVDQLIGPGVIHGNWLLITEANKLIPGTAQYVAINGGSASTNGFCETLVFQSSGPLMQPEPNWLGGDDTANVLTCDMTFGLARRVQVLYS